jgi:hypothetical protein
MNNKYINGMNEIKADDRLKIKIINSIKECKPKQITHLFVLKKTAALMAVACTFVLVITYGIQYIQNKDNKINQGQSTVETLFPGFVITAYAADKTHFTIKPDVDFPLGKYEMTMSSVPGFPLKILCNGADIIKLTVTDGEFLLWAPPAGKVYNKGKELEIKSGDTVYWSPLKEINSHSITSSCTISIKAFKNNKEQGSNTIKIESDNNYSYIGRLSR